MKKICIAIVFMLLIIGGTVVAVNYQSTDIKYSTSKNSNVINVKDALDDLYNKSNYYGVVGIFHNYRNASTITTGGFNNAYYLKTDYLTKNGASLTINETGKYKIYIEGRITTTASSIPYLKILKNSEEVLVTDFSSSAAETKSSVNVIVDAEKGDILINEDKGGGSPVYFVVTIEKVK